MIQFLAPPSSIFGKGKRKKQIKFTYVQLRSEYLHLQILNTIAKTSCKYVSSFKARVQQSIDKKYFSPLLDVLNQNEWVLCLYSN